MAQELPAANLTIRSQIPIAAGFGSGAALSAALIRACQRLAGLELPIDKLNELVYRAEQRYHGNPSGIDNHVVSMSARSIISREKRQNCCIWRRNCR